MEEKTCHSQAAEAALADIPADCEVCGLFSDLLPPARVQEGGELHLARARQEKVPDFRFLLPTPEGPQSCLAELKIVSAGKTWFPRGAAGKGVDRRADRRKLFVIFMSDSLGQKDK